MYKTLFILFGLLASPFALAHGGHDHSHKAIDEAQAKEKAVSTVANLVTEGKVDESWKTRQPSVEKKKFKKSTEWVATFQNPESKDLTKKYLYVFLTLSGDFVAANHTGK